MARPPESHEHPVSGDLPCWCTEPGDPRPPLMRREADPLIELLKAWMDENRRSPLDGTISCRKCAALVLTENSERHAAWHNALEVRTFV